MKLTLKQQRFLQDQITLWTGAPRDFELPSEFADLILGATETNLAYKDNQGNADFQHNPLFWSGRVLEPVINRWLAEELSRQGKRRIAPTWPKGKKFAVCLTHDVDWVNQTSLRPQCRQLRVILDRAHKGKNGFGAIVNSLLMLAFLTARRLVSKNQEGVFEPWLEAEDRFGFRSTFFFFPDQASVYHPGDGAFYRYHDKLNFCGSSISVAQLIRELESRGWEVGLHGTIESCRDQEELLRQKEQLEKCLQGHAVSIRQHCLCFDMLHTPRSQSLAGFKYDTTFGFNRIIGFRNGLALPFYHYDLQADAPLPILQIPLQVQDMALWRKDNLDLGPEEALARTKELIAKVEKVGGLVTLLWHPTAVDRHDSGLFWVYRELLAEVASKDAWVATVREIGEWWQQR